MSKIGCKHCNFKGYVKFAMLGSSPDEEGAYSVAICSHCKDARGYYAYVRNKYGKQSNVLTMVEEEPLADVLDFNAFKKKKEEDHEED